MTMTSTLLFPVPGSGSGSLFIQTDTQTKLGKNICERARYCTKYTYIINIHALKHTFLPLVNTVEDNVQKCNNRCNEFLFLNIYVQYVDIMFNA